MNRKKEIEQLFRQHYAVVKNIEILGEASNMLTEEVRQAHPKTPWKQVECIWPDCTSSRNADGITVLSPFFCSYTTIQLNQAKN